MIKQATETSKKVMSLFMEKLESEVVEQWVKSQEILRDLDARVSWTC